MKMTRRQYSNARRRQSHGRRGGFTLIEVLLVLIILVIIGALAVNTFTGTRERASINAARSNISLVRSAIDRYQLDFNKYPAKLSDLWEPPTDETAREKWTSEYMEPLKPDPWDNEYQYLAEGEKNPDKYDFWSNGPDGESGTDDDIGNWVKE
jgi:general secretion pathway protein G